MTDPLAQMRQSCEQILSNEFDSPGMFTTNLLANTDSLLLIRDAVSSEQSLFHVVKASGMSSVAVPVARNDSDIKSKNESAFVDLKPVRIDGKSTFIDPDVNFENTSATQVPFLIPPGNSKLLQASEIPTTPARRRTSQLETTADFDSKDMESLFNSLQNLVDKNPGLEDAAKIRAKASFMRQEYVALTNAIDSLQDSSSEH